MTLRNGDKLTVPDVGHVVGELDIEVMSGWQSEADPYFHVSGYMTLEMFQWVAEHVQLKATGKHFVVNEGELDG